MTTTTASSSAASTSSVPQQWVYPAPGAPIPPYAQTSNFGPVHLDDWMKLEWTPSYRTPEEIRLVCFSSEGDQKAYYTVATGASLPLTIQFNQKAGNSSSDDDNYCHLFFTDSSMGNTVVWQFDNNATDPATTWSAAEAATTSPSTSTTSSAPASSTTSQGPATTNTSTSTSVLTPTTTSIPSAISSAGSAGLSTGASAGIGVGVGLGVLALIATAGYLIWRRRRNSRHGRVSELDAQGRIFEADGQSPMLEIADGRRKPKELQGREVTSELPT